MTAGAGEPGTPGGDEARGPSGGTLVRAAHVRELRPGAARRVVVRGRAIALFNVNQTFYAVDDDCPHEEGGSLARGSVEDDSVWCPLHGARFALATGRALEPPEGEPMGPPTDRGVRTYPAVVIGDEIYLELGSG